MNTPKNINHFPLWTAVITPMNENLSIDYDALKNILEEQAAAQNAIVVLGSTGEALNLSKEEARSVLEFTLSKKLNVPIMTGIPGFNHSEVLNYIDYLNTLPLDAYLVVTPLYAKPGENGQREWFKMIMDRANKPCMLYNVPGRTGVKMNFEAIKSLNRHPRFWAIKEASGSVADFKKYAEAATHEVKMFSGDDGMLFDFRPIGCGGLVSVASNAWPKETHAYVQAALLNKLSKEEAKLWSKACDSLFIASNPIPIKNLMKYLGKITTPYLKLPLHHQDLSDHQELLNAHQNIQDWYSKR